MKVLAGIILLQRGRDRGLGFSSSIQGPLAAE